MPTLPLTAFFRHLETWFFFFSPPSPGPVGARVDSDTRDVQREERRRREKTSTDETRNSRSQGGRRRGFLHTYGAHGSRARRLLAPSAPAS